MRIEWWIYIGVYVITAALLFFIPKNKIRLAAAAFLFKALFSNIVASREKIRRKIMLQIHFHLK